MNETRRRRLRRGVVILPSAFTIGNLFLGIWAIVSASRGNFEFAGWLIVLAAVADMLDGRVARFTATGTAFGEELDSLVDAISFGVAPAMIAYFLYLDEGQWGWILSFFYIVGAICRLARFNIEQAGTAKTAFHGLPSPAAGVTVATFHAFTLTPVWRDWFPQVNPREAAAWMLVLLAALMVSSVLYPVMPRYDPRTWGGRLAVGLTLAAFVSALTVPALFFFPFSVLYISYGLVRTVLAGFHARLPERDPLVDGDPEEDDDVARPIQYDDFAPGPRVRSEEERNPEEEQP